MKDWRLLEFNVPIIEYATDDSCMIKGVAISETTTHNGHKYIAEELEKAAPGLAGKKLLVDHRNEVDAIKGKVTKANWNPAIRSIEFEAQIMDKHIQDMVRDGRISNVSIGAFAEDLIKQEDGSYIAKGIKFAELSLVAVPADENASFGVAMSRSIQMKESLSLNGAESAKLNSSMTATQIFDKDERRKDMTEEITEMENMKKQLAEFQSMQSELNILKAEKRKNAEDKYKALCQEKQVVAKDTQKMSDEVLNALTEQVAEIKISVKPEFKSHISENVPESANHFMIERNESGKNAMFVMPDSKGNYPKLSWQ